MSVVETPRTPTPEEILVAMMPPSEITRRLWDPKLTEPYLLAAMRLDERTRSIAAGHDNATSKVLRIAAADRQRDVRAAVAGNTNADPEILHTLARDRSKLVRETLVHNPSIAVETRDVLSRDPLTYIRVATTKGELSPKALDALTRNRETWVLQHVALRDDLNLTQIDRLRRHRSDVVRTAIVPKITDPEVLREMATDRSAQVARAVATNDFTPRDVLLDLSSHQDSEVRNALASAVAWFPAVALILCDDRAWDVRRTLAHRARLSYILERLSRDKDIRVRGAVAANLQTPPEVLERLMFGTSIEVAMQAIAHPTPPFDAVVRLQCSPIQRVRLLARERLDERPELRAPIGWGTVHEPLDQLLHWADTTTQMGLMADILRDPDCPDVVAEAILERKVETEVVEAGACSAQYSVRRAAARNHACSPETLDRLSQDPDHRVRAAVVWNESATLETLGRMRKQDTRASIREAARKTHYYRSLRPR